MAGSAPLRRNRVFAEACPDIPREGSVEIAGGRENGARRGNYLGLSSKTVDAHKFNLMRKLGIHNKAELVMWAIQKRVVKDSCLLARFAACAQAAASSARLEPAGPGWPSAALTAPTPLRADGRFTQTVARPSDCAGIDIVVKALPHVQDTVGGNTDTAQRQLENLQ